MCAIFVRTYDSLTFEKEPFTFAGPINGVSGVMCPFCNELTLLGPCPPRSIKCPLRKDVKMSI